MNESRKAFVLFCLLSLIVPGVPLFALLALARLPWPVVAGGTLAGCFVALLALCAAWVAGEEGER
jgi:hypothetical protein